MTTKKGDDNRTSITIQSVTSVSHVANEMKLMNTQQYVKMRNDAFINDGLTPTEYDYDVNGTSHEEDGDTTVSVVDTINQELEVEEETLRMLMGYSLSTPKTIRCFDVSERPAIPSVV